MQQIKLISLGTKQKVARSYQDTAKKYFFDQILRTFTISTKMFSYSNSFVLKQKHYKEHKTNETKQFIKMWTQEYVEKI